jgi:hypothetical protein
MADPHVSSATWGLCGTARFLHISASIFHHLLPFQISNTHKRMQIQIMGKMGWVGDIHEMEGAGHETIRPETSEKALYKKMHWTYQPGFTALQYIYEC